MKGREKEGGTVMKNIVVKICRNPRIMLSQEYNNIQNNNLFGGGYSSSFINKGFTSNLIINKDYEITSRNTRNFS